MDWQSQDFEVVMLLLVCLLFPLCAVYFYVEALRHGLKAGQWALAGVVLGPLLLPLFSIRCHLAIRQATGYGNVYLQA